MNEYINKLGASHPDTMSNKEFVKYFLPTYFCLLLSFIIVRLTIYYGF
jgi:hypothetical protein